MCEGCSATAANFISRGGRTFFAACLCCPIACNIFGIETCICFRDEWCSAGSIFRDIRNIISAFAPFFRREVAIASFFCSFIKHCV